MSEKETQLSQPVSKPWQFAKGKDPRRNAGGIDPKTRKLRKQLAKLDPKAMERLEALLDSGDLDYVVAGLQLWAKYRLPVPTEKQAAEVTVKDKRGLLSPELAARIAALGAH